MSLREASDRMEASYRHTQRLKGVVARSGPRKLTHGNTERCSGTAVDGSPAEDPGLIWHRVCSLQLHPFHREAFNRPRDSNQAGDGQKDSRGAGIVPWRRRRPPRHRFRRARKPKQGMMVLWDGPCTGAWGQASSVLSLSSHRS